MVYTQSSHSPPLHSLDEVLEGGELCALAPDPQSGHVGHVLWLRGSSGTTVHDSCLGQLLLQLQYSESSLAGLASSRGNQVLGLVTLVKHNLDPVKGIHQVTTQGYTDY